MPKTKAAHGKCAPKKMPVHIRGTKREGEVDIIVGEERKPPKRAERRSAADTKQKHSPAMVLRLPIRTLACSHPRNGVCQHCVVGIPDRVMYREAINRNPRILRLDAWRASLDSQQRNEAGMQDLKTTMAELQKQVMLHERYVCDGCVHCKEDSRP